MTGTVTIIKADPGYFVASYEKGINRHRFSELHPVIAWDFKRGRHDFEDWRSYEVRPLTVFGSPLPFQVGYLWLLKLPDGNFAIPGGEIFNEAEALDWCAGVAEELEARDRKERESA
jgi:hypothetical protein